jgi:hypothetical protein
MIAGIMKSMLIGLGVGLVWLPLCFLASLFFFTMRDLGIFLLLFLIPIGAIIAWIWTRKYLRQEQNQLRGAIGLSIRYFFLGAFLGFFLSCCACDVAFTTFFGGTIAAMIGSIGGAFQGWLWPRTSPGQAESQTTEDCDNKATSPTTKG